MTNSDKEEIQPKELVQFLALGTGLLDVCDDHRQLRLGFVRYQPEEGLAVVRQTRMRLLKEADDSTRAAILGIRDHLLANPPNPPIALNP